MHNGLMRGINEDTWAAAGQGLERSVQIARGQWRREEQGGAVRSAGWWESVTVTLSPSATSSRPASLLRRALGSAVDVIVPSIAEAAAASAWQFLDRRRMPRAALAPLQRRLIAGARALPAAKDR